MYCLEQGQEISDEFCKTYKQLKIANIMALVVSVETRQNWTLIYIKLNDKMGTYCRQYCPAVHTVHIQSLTSQWVSSHLMSMPCQVLLSSQDLFRYLHSHKQMRANAAGLHVKQRCPNSLRAKIDGRPRVKNKSWCYLKLNHIELNHIELHYIL